VEDIGELNNDIVDMNNIIKTLNITLIDKDYQLKSKQIILDKYFNNEVKLNKISKEELKEFLKKDKTDELTYEDKFDCNAFSFTLIRNLYDYGYLAYPVYIEYSDSAHMIVSIYDENGELIYIEPQNDDIIDIDLDKYYKYDDIEEINSIEGVFVN
jgi:hypothetical protein